MYYWLTGEFVNFDKGKDTDVWALANGYVGMVPAQFDLTNYVLKSQLRKTLDKMILKKDNLKSLDSYWDCSDPVLGLVIIWLFIKYSSFSAIRN